MNFYIKLKRTVSIVVMIAFLFQSGVSLYSTETETIEGNFNEARAEYLNGNYKESKEILTNLFGYLKAIELKEMDKMIVLWKCYLLLGIIYETTAMERHRGSIKKNEKREAKRNYKKARSIWEEVVTGKEMAAANGRGVIAKPRKRTKPAGEKIEKVLDLYKTDLDKFKYYQKYFLGKKKIPWHWIIIGAVAAGLIIYFLLRPKEYTLTVDKGEGVEGLPESGSQKYKKDDTVSYSYSLKSGYTNLVVMLDGNPAPDNGIIKMDRDHTLTARAEQSSLGFIIDQSEVKVPEDGTALFNVRLSEQPPSDIHAVVSKVKGDEDISIRSGSKLTFTTSDWGNQKVTLAASADNDDEDGEATFMISALGMQTMEIKAVEDDKDKEEYRDRLMFLSDKKEVTVPEGATDSIKIWLSQKPSSVINANVKIVKGDADFYIQSGAEWAIEPEDWQDPHKVVIGVKEDEDAVHDQAKLKICGKSVDSAEIESREIPVTETDKDRPQFVTNVEEVDVAESGTTSFEVRLSRKPSSTVTAEVVPVSGSDNDIWVKDGSPWIIKPEDWNKPHQVMLAAKEDEDAANDQAVFEINGISEDGTVPGSVEITAKERDKHKPEFVTDKEEITIEEGKIGSFTVTLSRRTSSTIKAEAVITEESTDSIMVIDGSCWTILPGDWDKPHTVKLEAQKEPNEINDQAKIKIRKVESTPENIEIKDKALTVKEVDTTQSIRNWHFDPLDIQVWTCVGTGDNWKQADVPGHENTVIWAGNIGGSEHIIKQEIEIPQDANYLRWNISTTKYSEMETEQLKAKISVRFDGSYLFRSFNPPKEKGKEGYTKDIDITHLRGKTGVLELIQHTSSSLSIVWSDWVRIE